MLCLVRHLLQRVQGSLHTAYTRIQDKGLFITLVFQTFYFLGRVFFFATRKNPSRIKSAQASTSLTCMCDFEMLGHVRHTS
ncbi:hypothetical protein GDO78_008851 [Eleutherodactylus coqui]|uniref:Uncharacterized protein n=1 Tax=Eleutherodactylus coqui TaxID=57060 RepID=A0A8J6KEI5_ELECQ|nr:hypothetical protein GDO78_008851 [Eleutherodactylus coqui]